ncbi:hypothetical protein [Acaryochloris marina]|nr:hypothetical protein [Acaryochloris marina]
MSEYSFKHKDCLVRMDRSTQVLSVEVNERETRLRPRDCNRLAFRSNDDREAIPLFSFHSGPFEPSPAPTIAEEVSGKTVPLMAFAYKAKRFNDWLYGTLDRSAFLSDSPVLGRQALVSQLRVALDDTADRVDLKAMLCAAEYLGGGSDLSHLPGELRLRVKQALKEFEAKPLVSRPIGFYSASESLRRLFQHDRMLQQPLDRNAAQVLRDAITQAQLLNAYRWHLQANEQLTGQFAVPSVMAELSPENQYALFPPSRAPETDLIKQLYGNVPIPDDFCLLDEVIVRVKGGRLDLSPAEDDGWYLRELYALEALLNPSCDRLRVGPKYGETLEQLFKGLMSLARETHIKQLESPYAGGAMLNLAIMPHLRLEPVPRYYERMAHNYGWLLDGLVELWGESALTREVRNRNDQPTCILDSLTEMQALFSGAAALCREDLGFPTPPMDAVGCMSRGQARKFLSNWKHEPDLLADCRMMVPLYHDVMRKKTRVSVVCGVLSQKISVQFEQKPQVQITDATGRSVNTDITWLSSAYTSVYPVQFECDVSDVLDRETFQNLADQHPVPSELKAVLKAL